MQYEKIYSRLIESRKNRIFEDIKYTEKHHIIPKCLGGLDKKENLIRLTFREHFIAHWLLVKIYPNDQKILSSFAKMLEVTKTKKRIVSSWMFDTVKRNLKDIHFHWLKGKDPWNKGKKGSQVPWNKGKKIGPMSKEQKKQISETLKLRYKNKEHPRKGKDPWNKYKKGSQKAWNKGIPSEKYICRVCKREIAGKTNLNRWHNENCKKQ